MKSAITLSEPLTGVFLEEVTRALDHRVIESGRAGDGAPSGRAPSRR